MSPRPSKLADVLSLILRALRSNGLHFATFKSGTIAGRDTLGRYFNILDQNRLAAAYAKSGSWESLSMTEYFSDNHFGRQDRWIAISARKPIE